MNIAALFPHGISELFNWKGIFFNHTIYEINKPVIMSLISTAVCLILFVGGGRKKALVPSGLQNVAEISYEFIDREISYEAIGEESKKWTPFLATMFFWIFFMNIWSTVPFVQFPATSRIAFPIVGSIAVYIVFIVAGFMKHGPLYIFKTIFPPGVPWYMIWLIGIIEFVSKFMIRPLSLAVRLFANMFAGHILLGLFTVMVAALVEMNSGAYQGALALFPFIGLIVMIGFELFVATLQAYIFTVLAAVYIADSLAEEH